MKRRRRWAASGALPPALAARFTLAETAVLAVLAAEVLRHGACTLTIGHIAALAGVSETTVRNGGAPGRVGVRARKHQRNGSHLLGHTDHSCPSRLVTRDLIHPFVEGVSVMALDPGPADLSMLRRCRFKRLP